MFEIRLAKNNCRSRIVEILNTVTLSLQQKNINQWTYPCDSKKLEMDIKNKNTYVLESENIIIGTFSLKNLVSNSWVLSVRQNDLYLYGIAILPEYQGKNIGRVIIDYSCKISRDTKKTLYLDCWAGNEKLKNFYIKAGLDYCGDFPEEDYMISVYKFESKGDNYGIKYQTNEG